MAGRGRATGPRCRRRLAISDTTVTEAASSESFTTSVWTVTTAVSPRTSVVTNVPFGATWTGDVFSSHTCR